MVNIDEFVKFLKDFDRFGKKTTVETVSGIRYFVNEYWTSAQRQAHSIHEIPYRACFKPQLPEFFISTLTDEGDTVHDPFMGRGTTPVQSFLMKRRAFGTDVNPLSVLLTRPRLRPVTVEDVETSLKTIDWRSGEIERDDLLVFYHPETLKKLSALRKWLSERAPLSGGDVDPVADWIRMVAITRLTGHSSGFFSVRTMPPNQAVSTSSQKKINEKYGLTPPERDVVGIIVRKTRSLLRHELPSRSVGHFLMMEKAWHTPMIDDSSVDLVVTSPPFLDVVHYAKDNWLRCWFSGIDVDTVEMDIHRTEKAWAEMVRKVLLEQSRITRSGGVVAFEVGEVRKGEVLLERLVWGAAEGLPFERIGVMVNSQEFTKTSNCWNITNGRKGTNTNRIVLLKRT